MFSPGTEILEFTSKKGNKIVLRFAENNDAKLLTKYINELSKEDTFVTFSGEDVSLDHERKFLEKLVADLEKGEGFLVLGMMGEELVAVGDIQRLEKRSKHAASMGISVKKEFRGEGVGYQLINSLLEVAQRISIQMIQLSVYAPNESAKKLYENVGFQEVGRIPKKILFHGELVDEIIMVKFL